jgi:hypothetical protein
MMSYLITIASLWATSFTFIIIVSDALEDRKLV